MEFFSNWENKDLVSAMLSCLAVLVSFTTLIWQWRCKHPRYKISTHSASPNFIFEYNQRSAYLSKADIAMLNLQLDDLPTSARCVVFLQLANLSETAITITEATLIDDTTKKKFVSNYRIKGVNYLIGKVGNEPFTLDMEKEQLHLPIVLPPYGVKFGYILFIITEAKPFIGTVILHSPIGTKKFKVQCDTIENVLKTKKSYLPKIKEF